MKFLKTILIFAVLLTIFSGCANSAIQEEEVVQEKKVCDREDLECLELAYEESQINRIINTEDKETQFRIIFDIWLPLDDYKRIFIDNEIFNEMVHVQYYFPDVMNGTRWNLHTYYDMVSREDFIDYTMDQLIAEEAEDDFSIRLKEGQKEAFDKNNVFVGSIRTYSMPKEILEWWYENDDVVRFIQTFESEVDNIQRSWEPGSPIR